MKPQFDDLAGPAIHRSGDRLDLEALDGSIRIAAYGSCVVFTVNHPRATLTFALDAPRAVLVARHVLQISESIAAGEAHQNGAGRELSADHDPQAEAAEIAAPESHS